MKTPFFSRREVLNFLVHEAPKIEAGSEQHCWRECWARFSNGVFDSHDDLPYLEFQRVCQFYGYAPEQNLNHTWSLKSASLAPV